MSFIASVSSEINGQGREKCKKPFPPAVEQRKGDTVTVGSFAATPTGLDFPARSSFSTVNRKRRHRLSHLGQTLNPRMPVLP